jgi:8-oxo-dGTP diphosphatase
MFDSDSPTSSSCKPPELKSLWVVAAVIRHGNQIFVAKRKAGGGSGLKWEFPGGKVEASESASQALKREIREELSISIQVGQSLGTFTTPQDEYLIQLECYWCITEDQQISLTNHDEAGWFEPNELRLLDWALPDVPVLEVVLRTIADESESEIV